MNEKELSKLISRRAALAADLDKTRLQLVDKSETMGAAVLAGKDPAKIAGEIASIQQQESVLLAGLAAADYAIESGRGDLATEQATKALAEIEATRQAVDFEAVEILQAAAELLDRATALQEQVNQAERLIYQHKLNGRVRSMQYSEAQQRTLELARLLRDSLRRFQIAAAFGAGELYKRAGLTDRHW
jgi:hypothetical protein